ncbi:LysR family transcriptional regulator [Prauserella cavernicola]|uniref:LysR family transcriptional regulator n=1 Tax=Prauserella cavernicola TaxID=2800127 RepID=A0A934QWY7_9PSEU|nr:LysR family transcriptional regulator [Prauserella cavernicola]MBK1787966.1 LysR family transcriptional regulator [Prauserella cavernicola]
MISLALRYFLETVERGSIGAAAEYLHVAPSAVSRMIKKLETDHGVELLERQPRGVVTTEAGDLLAAYARRLSVDADRTRSDIRALRKLGQRHIKIAANQSFALEMLPRLMNEFQNREPEVVFELSVVQSPVVNSRVREGRDDIGLSYELARPEGVDILHAHTVRVYATMTADHPLATRSELLLRDVVPFPLALMGAGSTVRVVVDRCAQYEQIELHPALTSNNVGAIQNYCRERGAVAFCGKPTVMASVDRGEFVLVPLAHGTVSERSMYIQAMAGRTVPRSVAEFAGMVSRQMVDI